MPTYDTQSTFQNLIKLEYTPSEDDIIQKIEVGVSMPLNSSLIGSAKFIWVKPNCNLENYCLGVFFQAEIAN
jgi:cell surface protein SprA